MTTVHAASLYAPRLFQFRLATLLLFMVWAGVISLGIRTPNFIAAALIGLMTWVIVLASILLAVYRTERIRAGAIGFALFCGAFLGGGIPFYGGHAAGQLSSLIYVMFNPPAAQSASADPFATNLSISDQNLQSVCAFACATLLGCVGAICAQILQATQRREPTESRSVRP